MYPEESLALSEIDVSPDWTDAYKADPAGWTTQSGLETVMAWRSSSDWRPSSGPSLEVRCCHPPVPSAIGGRSLGYSPSYRLTATGPALGGQPPQAI